MAAHVRILLEVTDVIVKQDTLGPTVTQVRTTFEGSFFQFNYFYVIMNALLEILGILYRTSSGEKFHSVYIRRIPGHLIYICRCALKNEVYNNSSFLMQ